MSAATELPVVIGIAALPAALLIGGVALCVLAVRRCSRSMPPKSRKALEQVMAGLLSPSSDVLRPLSLVEREARDRMEPAMTQLKSHRLSSLDELRVSTLASLASAPYLVRDDKAVDKGIEALLEAKSMKEARSARKDLEETVKSGHKEIFDASLTRAASNAMGKIGFAGADIGRGAYGNMRVTATDADGRSLVAEIQYGKNGHPRLAAEVVGVSDGTCHNILDRFEKALDEQGVRHTSPRRVSTGGVCLLDAARDFLRRRQDREANARPAASPPTSKEDSRRARQLNRRKVQVLRESR